MKSVVFSTITAEYDLLDENVATQVIESYFAKPLASWEPAALEPGEAEVVRRTFVRSAETRTIEIDRKDHVVWVTFHITMELDYDERALGYFGTTIESIVEHGIHVTLPLDERVIEHVEDQFATRLA